ncbi:formate--tetrahydrofolate ligase [Paenibacillus sp. CMAA1364]
MKPIIEIAQSMGVHEDHLELYGKYKCKISPTLWEEVKERPNGRLVLVTAMNPTPAGEGKTLTTIGLSQALNAIGEPTIAALREPSLGPCFGMKGGATGSGKAQIVPADDINLHFTGDIHAITSAHNLLSALIDNHLFHGNELQLNPGRIVWKRAMDMNDRSLRSIVTGIGNGNGNPREAGFLISTASEVMAVLCLSQDLHDLRNRLGKILIGYTHAGEAVTATQLNAVEAMVILLKDAMKPNLVQTLEGTPVIIHGGPFANIAHGCSSIVGLRLALKLADIVVTEAGFGADLGAEKFFDITCREADLIPDVAVLVVTIKALKYNGGVANNELDYPNSDALKMGLANMERHIENIHKFGVPVMVVINHYFKDLPDEVELVKERCHQLGVAVETSTVWADGGAGGKVMAEQLVAILNSQQTNYSPLYPKELSVKSKIEKVVTEIYRGQDVSYSPSARRGLAEIERFGYGNLPVCMAKTPYSFSDQPRLLGAPEGFTIHISDISISAGAGFIVVHTGNIVTMPGLPKSPAAEHMRLDEHGDIIGLF